MSVSHSSFGDGNHGVQIYRNSGPIHAEFNVQPQSSETPPEPTSNVPFCHNQNFVGRADIIERLTTLCSTPPTRAALLGPSGVGKSQIAIEYAHRVRESASNAGENIWVFWVYAATKHRFQKGFHEIAEAADIRRRKFPGSNIYQLVEQWLFKYKHKWLMVLDSADDASVFDATVEVAGEAASPRPLWSYLPHSGNGTILMTTNNQVLADRLSNNNPNNIIPVEPMDPGESLRLFQTEKGGESDLNAGPALMRVLGFMPLAISQAAAYIRQMHPLESVRSYLDDFQKTDEDKVRLLDLEVFGHRDWSAQRTIIAACQITIEHIDLKSPHAIRLLGVLSLFDGQGILLSMVRAKGLFQPIASSKDDKREFNANLAILRNYCLIKINSDSYKSLYVEMHPVLQLSVRTWLYRKGKLEHYKALSISLLHSASPRMTFYGEQHPNGFLSHVEVALDHGRPTSGESLQGWASILYDAGMFAYFMSKFETAQKMAEEACNVRRSLFGQYHASTLEVMHLLSNIQKELHSSAEAMPFSLEVIRAPFGDNRAIYLDFASGYIITLIRRGQYEEALEMAKKVNKAYEREPDLDYPYMIRSIAYLALTHSYLNQWDQSTSYTEELVETIDRLMGSSDNNTIVWKIHLAALYSRQPDRSEKVKNLLTSIVQDEEAKDEIKDWDGLMSLIEDGEAFRGPTRPEILVVVKRFSACILKRWGQIDEAVELLEDCVGGLIKTYGFGHNDTKSAQAMLNEWMSEQEEAEAMTSGSNGSETDESMSL